MQYQGVEGLGMIPEGLPTEEEGCVEKIVPRRLWRGRWAVSGLPRVSSPCGQYQCSICNRTLFNY